MILLACPRHTDARNPSEQHRRHRGGANAERSSRFAASVAIAKLGAIGGAGVGRDLAAVSDVPVPVRPRTLHRALLARVFARRLQGGLRRLGIELLNTKRARFVRHRGDPDQLDLDTPRRLGRAPSVC